MGKLYENIEYILRTLHREKSQYHRSKVMPRLCAYVGGSPTKCQCVKFCRELERKSAQGGIGYE